MEKVALSIIAFLAASYLIFTIYSAITILPWGIFILLGVVAGLIYFYKAINDKLKNTEDLLYNERIEP